MNEPHETAAEYAARFDREWAAIVEPIIDELDRARGIEPDDQAEETIDLQLEMDLSRQRRRAG